MRLALAQIDTTVGDLEGNRERILSRPVSYTHLTLPTILRV